MPKKFFDQVFHIILIYVEFNCPSFNFHFSMCLISCIGLLALGWRGDTMSCSHTITLLLCCFMQSSCSVIGKIDAGTNESQNLHLLLHISKRRRDNNRGRVNLRINPKCLSSGQRAQEESLRAKRNHNLHLQLLLHLLNKSLHLLHLHRPHHTHHIQPPPLFQLLCLLPLLLPSIPHLLHFIPCFLPHIFLHLQGHPTCLLTFLHNILASIYPTIHLRCRPSHSLSSPPSLQSRARLSSNLHRVWMTCCPSTETLPDP